MTLIKTLNHRLCGNKRAAINPCNSVLRKQIHVFGDDKYADLYQKQNKKKEKNHQKRLADLRASILSGIVIQIT